MQSKSFITGMLAGVAVAFGTTMILSTDKKKMSKKTSKLFSTMGNVADNILDMYHK